MNARVLKKYSNRRLYDIQTSAYVTAKAVRQFILAGETIQVVDAKTSEDLTHSVLLQIMHEADASGQHILSSDFLLQLIRLQANPAQNVLADFLSHHLDFFVKVQAHLKEYNQDPAPIKAWGDFVEQQTPAVQTLLNQYLDDGVDLFLALQQALQQPSSPKTSTRLFAPMPTLKKRGRKPKEKPVPLAATDPVVC